MKGLALQRVELSDRLFETTPGLERVPLTWLDADDVPLAEEHARWPNGYCSGTVIGYWGRSADAVAIRYMPCLERVTWPTRLCGQHTLLVARPKPQSPTLWPNPVSAPAVIDLEPKPPKRVLAVLAAIKPEPEPPPKPPPPVPVPRAEWRCRDCGDKLESYRATHRCYRCDKLRRDASRLRPAKTRADLVVEAEERDRAADATASVTPYWRCIVCDKRMDERRSACTQCIEADRWREQPMDSPGMSRDMGDWPYVAASTNRRGETVVNGRVLPHNRFGESKWDQFGDTPELED